MSDTQQCPKCGQSRTYNQAKPDAQYACGSFGEWQSDRCRIRELTAENAALSARVGELEAECARLREAETILDYIERKHATRNGMGWFLSGQYIGPVTVETRDGTFRQAILAALAPKEPEHGNE